MNFQQQTQFLFDATFLPQPRGELNRNLLCDVYGWGDDSSEPRSDMVIVRDFQQCDLDSPDAFCSHFDSFDHETCSAALGSPVVCLKSIAGFVTNNQNCSNINETLSTLNYQSIGNFSDWIQDVTYYTATENTVRFILNVAHFTSPDLTTAVVRCAASVITNIHVLTTASCVIVEEPQAIAVRAVVGDLISEIFSFHREIY